MNNDTIRQVQDILTKKWYSKSQTLGEGGWAKIHSSGIDWKTYVLYGESEDNTDFHEVETIIADDDDTAMNAFQKLYNLDMFLFWEIQERIVEYRLVGMKVEE